MSCRLNMASKCDPMDDGTSSHGTHISGTIGAVGNNTLGVVGVNWTARIMGLKFLNQNGSRFASDAIDAIDFAVQAKTIFGATGEANVRILSKELGWRRVLFGWSHLANLGLPLSRASIVGQHHVAQLKAAEPQLA